MTRKLARAARAGDRLPIPRDLDDFASGNRDGGRVVKETLFGQFSHGNEQDMEHDLNAAMTQADSWTSTSGRPALRSA
jgi:hypothetical protein